MGDTRVPLDDPKPSTSDKVTGSAKYTVDIHHDGQLEGVILRSPFAHARISELDLAAARAQLDQVAWETAWAAGRALSMEQAITEAEQALREAEASAARRQIQNELPKPVSPRGAKQVEVLPRAALQRDLGRRWRVDCSTLNDRGARGLAG